MNFSFHPEAEKEFKKTIDYYEEIKPRLGYNFAKEVYSTVRRVVAFPKAWAVLDGEIRQSLVKRFPYGVLYSEEKEGILIIAVMNLHRKPDYWKYR